MLIQTQRSIRRAFLKSRAEVSVNRPISTQLFLFLKAYLRLSFAGCTFHYLHDPLYNPPKLSASSTGRDTGFPGPTCQELWDFHPPQVQGPWLIPLVKSVLRHHLLEDPLHAPLLLRHLLASLVGQRWLQGRGAMERAMTLGPGKT